MGIHPRTDLPEEWDVEKKTVRVREPHKNKGAKDTKYVTVIHYVPQQCDCPLKEKGSNKIDPTKVAEHYLFQTPDDDRDVSIIVGYTKGAKSASLLLMRFHKLPTDLRGGETPQSLLSKLTVKLEQKKRD